MSSELFAQVDVLRVLDHANDSHISIAIETDVSPEYVGGAERFLRELLVDDHDLRRAAAIVVVEITPSDERNLECLEVIGGNSRDGGPHLFTFARRVTLDDDAVLIPATGHE